MKGYRYSILVLLIAYFPATGAIRLSGKVTDDTNNSINGAVVTLHTRDSLGTLTDASGNFELTDSTIVATVRDAKSVYNRNITGSCGVSLHRIVSIHDINGRLLLKLPAGENRPAARTAFSPGIYLITASADDGSVRVFRYIHRGNTISLENILRTHQTVANHPDQSRSAQGTDFIDILVVSAAGRQTVRRAVVSEQEGAITIKMMPAGVNYITPGIPLYTNDGGTGDVTTYGSVSNPEFSQGGACNYGSTGIKYYAAINVNQLPGDARGQWNNGRCCGRCARVRIRTADGEVRTTVVRIVDKCPDDDCGIDLGGAPAGEIMHDQPGRYSGEWEWVNCDESEGVSDGPPSIYTKEGTNGWWSLIQVRNGSGGVADIRTRKSGVNEWTSLEWATEAENFFKTPPEMLQDDDNWEIEVIWDTGSRGSLVLPGTRLAIEDTTYLLSVGE